MAIVSFSVSSEVNQKIIRLARKQKTTKSKIVERAINHFLKHQRDSVTITLPRGDWQKRLKKIIGK